MHQHIFINLPVADLPRAMVFYQALGYKPNPQFTSDTAGCIVISEVIHLMLLTHAKFREFSPKAICDTSTSLQALFALSCESRAKVDALVANAKAAGGTVFEEARDHGFMYEHSFLDPDGHGWGPFHMTAMPEAQ